MSNPDMTLDELKQRFQRAEANLSRIAEQSRDVLTGDAKQADTQRLHQQLDMFKTEMNDIRNDLKNAARKREVDKLVNNVDGVSKTVFADTVKTITGQRDASGVRMASPVQLQQRINDEVAQRREANR